MRRALCFLAAVVGSGCQAPLIVPAPGDGTSGCDGVVATLPTTLHEASVLDAAGALYVVGGGNGGEGLSDEILSFDPGTHALGLLPVKLPSPRQAMAAAWVGSTAYFFGGRGQGPALIDEVVEWAPPAGPVLKSARFPTGRYNMAAVSTGQVIYLFGGWSWAGGDLRDVFRYDPATDQLTQLPVVLPEGRQAPNAFFDGADVWVVGGVTNGSSSLLRFSPQTESFQVMPVSVDGWDMAPLWDGQRAHLLGGIRRGAVTDEVVLFDPAVPSFTALGKRSPALRTGRAAALQGRGYVFGGADPAFAPVDTVICYEPP